MAWLLVVVGVLLVALPMVGFVVTAMVSPTTDPGLSFVALELFALCFFLGQALACSGLAALRAERVGGDWRWRLLRRGQHGGDTISQILVGVAAGFALGAVVALFLLGAIILLTPWS